MFSQGRLNSISVSTASKTYCKTAQYFVSLRLRLWFCNGRHNAIRTEMTSCHTTQQTYRKIHNDSKGAILDKFWNIFMQVYRKKIWLFNTFTFNVKPCSAFSITKFNRKANHWRGLMHQHLKSLWVINLVTTVYDLAIASNKFGKWVQDQKAPTCLFHVLWASM